MCYSLYDTVQCPQTTGFGTENGGAVGEPGKEIDGQTEQLIGEVASLRETCEKLVIQMAAK